MSGPRQFVSPSNGAFAGGALNRTRGAPTRVQGGFTLVNSTGVTPPDVNGAPIISARNNRGTNVQIPHMRIVPLHGKDKLRVDDNSLVGNGRTHAYEYDGLESGELAWCLGKCFQPENPGDGGPSTTPGDAPISATGIAAATHVTNLPVFGERPPTREEINAGTQGYQPTNTGASNAGLSSGAFSGYGPDRMQRLAYTSWMEAFFKERIGVQTIDLLSATNFAGTHVHGNMDGEIAEYRALIARASVVAMPDLAYALHQPFQHANELRITRWDSGDAQAGQPMPNQPNNAKFVKQRLAGAQLQGLFVMEDGPFLRSMSVDKSDVPACSLLFNAAPDDPNPLGTAIAQARVQHAKVAANTISADDPAAVDAVESGQGETSIQPVPRSLGSELAQRALACILRRNGLMNWIPDGVVLSKLANGPDGYADMEYDARSGALFNVGISGPCVTKTWTGDYRNEAQPLDKVFILMVADLSYNVSARDDADDTDVQGAVTRTVSNTVRGAKGGAAAANAADRGSVRSNRVKGPYSAAYGMERDGGADVPTTMSSAMAELGALPTLFDAQRLQSVGTTNYSDAFQAYRTAWGRWVAQDKSDKAAETAAWNNVKAAVATVKAEMGSDDSAAGKERRGHVGPQNEIWRDVADGVRDGRRDVTHAKLSNFRLMRATSSFLINYSNPYKRGDADRRCGLPIGFAPGGTPAEAASGCGSYIVGGWCIGTVLDSGASRATAGINQVRTAPCSMAMSVNVNVEWWTADDLYTRYMDVPRGAVADPGDDLTWKNSTVKTRTQATEGKTDNLIKTIQTQPGVMYEVPILGGTATDDTRLVTDSADNVGHTRWYEGTVGGTVV